MVSPGLLIEVENVSDGNEHISFLSFIQNPTDIDVTFNYIDKCWSF